MIASLLRVTSVLKLCAFEHLIVFRPSVNPISGLLEFDVLTVVCGVEVMRFNITFLWGKRQTIRTSRFSISKITINLLIRLIDCR